MEYNSRSDEKAPVQKFYINDEGKLVVESNNGVIVDGNSSVICSGTFTCSAHTMGEIIAKLNGVPVEIGVKERIVIRNKVTKDVMNLEDIHTIDRYCIVGVKDDNIKSYFGSIGDALVNALNNKVDSLESQKQQLADNVTWLQSRYKKLSIQNGDYEVIVHKFNEMPWYRRLFKKIKLH